MTEHLNAMLAFFFVECEVIIAEIGVVKKFHKTGESCLRYKDKEKV
jgi:hypothetical protein